MGKLLLISSFFFMSLSGNAQQTDSLYMPGKNVPEKISRSVADKYRKLQTGLDKQTRKLLHRIENYERRLYKKVYRKDSLLAGSIWGKMPQAYRIFKDRTDPAQLPVPVSPDNYIPQLDKLGTSLSFLTTNAVISQEQLQRLQLAAQQVHKFRQKMAEGMRVKELLREKRAFLQEKLKGMGLDRQLQKINKEMYYYSQWLQNFKKAVSDPHQAEARIIAALQKIPAFNQFFRRHSELAFLFPEPAAYGNAQALQGLQSRDMIQQLVQQSLAPGGPGAVQVSQQNFINAQAKLDQLKNDFISGGAGDPAAIPSFKPNSQRTKTFLQRVEFGTNLQSQRASRFFPLTSDLGLSAGYKLNDKSIIGIGASYKVGWGRNIRQIQISHQGAGLRSFIDWRIKKGFSLSGGYEKNYRTAIRDITELRNATGWQNSGLVGISKQYKAGKKLTGEAKLLFDFLSYRQVPRTQALIFRISYLIHK